MKNVLDLIAGSHQIVCLTVVKGGEDGTDTVGDDIHVVRCLFNPSQVDELSEFTTNSFTRNAGNVRNLEGVAGKVLSLTVERSRLVAAAFVVEAFCIAGSDFAEN